MIKWKINEKRPIYWEKKQKGKQKVQKIGKHKNKTKLKNSKKKTKTEKVNIV